jgi:hypothetical protein
VSLLSLLLTIQYPEQYQLQAPQNLYPQHYYQQPQLQVQKQKQTQSQKQHFTDLVDGCLIAVCIMEKLVNGTPLPQISRDYYSHPPTNILNEEIHFNTNLCLVKLGINSGEVADSFLEEEKQRVLTWLDSGRHSLGEVSHRHLKYLTALLNKKPVQLSSLLPAHMQSYFPSPKDTTKFIYSLQVGNKVADNLNHKFSKNRKKKAKCELAFDSNPVDNIC